MANDGEDPTLDVQINVRANTQGAEQAKRALKEVGQAAEQSGAAAARASVQHGSAFGRIVTGSRSLSAAMRGLTQVMHGGIFAAGGFAQAINALTNVVRAAVVASGPWALLALGVGAVIGVMRGLATAARGAGSGLKGTHKEADDLKKALAEVEKESKEDLKKMEESANRLAESYATLTTRIKETQDRVDKLNASQHKLDMALLDSAEARELAAAQTPQQRTEISGRYKAQREGLEERFKVGGLETDIFRSNIESNLAKKVVGQVRTELINAELSTSGASAARAAAVGKSRAASDQFQLESSFGGTPAADAAYSNLKQTQFDAKVAVDAEKKAKANEVEIQGKLAVTTEKAAQASAAAETKGAVAKLDLKTELERQQEKERSIKRGLESDLLGVDTQSEAKGKRLQGELSSLGEEGFMSSSFSDPKYAARVARRDEVKQALDALAGETAIQRNTIIDFAQKQLKETRKATDQIKNAPR